MSIIRESYKKKFGFVKTPDKTAEYIISKLGNIKKKHKILDPSVGPGIFVEKLLKNKIHPSQIYAFDINPLYKKQIKDLGANFKIKDTLLEIDKDSHNKFDFIIGNPPYLNKASNYIRENKNRLKKIYGKINAHETYSMFIVNCIWRLKEGGILGFITSDSYLTLSTHKKLRKFILETCKIKELLCAPRNLFDNQNVTTNPAIIILEKCPGIENQINRKENVMRIIPFVNNEDDYLNPKKIHYIKQNDYDLLPFNIFYTNIENGIIKLFEKANKLDKYLTGYIGMHTHNNQKYIAAIKGSNLAKIFEARNKNIVDPNKKYKIIPKQFLRSDKWKPYMKRGGADQYFRPIIEALDWDPKSISLYDIPEKVPFESDGIVISGISSRLAARYIPKGCYWDSNKAIGFIIKDNSLSIGYVLGLLNSSLYNYLAKGIINNTNSIQLTSLHTLPFIKPTKELDQQIKVIVDNIIKNKMITSDYDYSNDQKQIDNLIYKYYSKKFNFPNSLKEKLDSEYSIYQT
ncbi:MAG: N-6 DNA methylase [Candidatus Lokiarchaeota archaeon]|nr:N-6 DNA methylase [Candidatus Lokiarchaeota archaeon]